MLMQMQVNNSEQVRHNQNHVVEREIGFLEKSKRRQITKKVIPKWLWYFGVVYKAELLSRMSRGKGKRTGCEEVTSKSHRSVIILTVSYTILSSGGINLVNPTSPMIPGG